MERIKFGDEALMDLAEEILKAQGYEVERYDDVLIIRIKEVRAS